MWTKNASPCCSVHVSGRSQVCRGKPRTEKASRLWLLHFKIMLFVEHCFHRLDVVLCLLLLSSYLRMNHSSSFVAWKQVTRITLSLRTVLVLCQGGTGSPAELLWPVSSLRAAAPLSQVLYTAHSTRLSTCGMNACVTTTLGLTDDRILSVTSSMGGFLEHRMTMRRQVAHHVHPNRWRVKSQPCMQKGHPANM